MIKTPLLTFTAVLRVSIFIMIAWPAHAERPMQMWVQRYNGSGNGDDFPSSIAVDGSNNVIVAGSSTVGTYPNDRSEWLVIKYSSTGVPLWTDHYSGPGEESDIAKALAVDGNSDVIVAGGSSMGSHPNGHYDIAVIKYSSMGTPLWTNFFNGSNDRDDYPVAVAVDSDNNVVITGYSDSGGYEYDYLTIQYSSEGTPLWTNRFSGTESKEELPSKLAVDGNNNVIVTGYSHNSESSWDYATVAYSRNGMPLWTNRYNGTGNGEDAVNAIAVDRFNNVIVTGYSYSSNETNYDYVTIQYSSAGVPLWTNRYDGPTHGGDAAVALAVDGNNNIIVTGSSTSSNGTNYDYATIQYSSAGVPLWTNRFSVAESINAAPTAVVVDGDNNIIVAGSGFDHPIIIYSNTGLALWTNRYSGPENPGAFTSFLAVDSNNDMIVTGVSWSSESKEDWVTVKYARIPRPLITDLKLINDAWHMRVDDVFQPGTLVIEASTDLMSWVPVFTNTTTTNVLFYADPRDGAPLSRFYRAFQFP